MSVKAKIPFSWTRLLALKAAYSVTLKKFATFLNDHVSGAKMRTWIISLFVFIVESFSFISWINQSKHSALICNLKKIFSIASINIISIASIQINFLWCYIQCSSNILVNGRNSSAKFLLPKLTLPDNGWECTFSGNIPTDRKHSDMSCQSCSMLCVSSMLFQCCEFLLSVSLCSLAESTYHVVGSSTYCYLWGTISSHYMWYK